MRKIEKSMWCYNIKLKSVTHPLTQHKGHNIQIERELIRKLLQTCRMIFRGLIK